MTFYSILFLKFEMLVMCTEKIYRCHLGKLFKTDFSLKLRRLYVKVLGSYDE